MSTAVYEVPGEPLVLYRLFRVLELWDWFAQIGNTGPLAGIAEDIRALASP